MPLPLIVSPAAATGGPDVCVMTKYQFGNSLRRCAGPTGRVVWCRLLTWCTRQPGMHPSCCYHTHTRTHTDEADTVADGSGGGRRRNAPGAVVVGQGGTRASCAQQHLVSLDITVFHRLQCPPPPSLGQTQPVTAPSVTATALGSDQSRAYPTH
jgi:hypothetical protein